jgi:branched-chain amino acid aminotransferase
MTIPVLSGDDYAQRLLSLPRACAGEILAFYEHRVGAVCTDARLMLLPLDDHLAHRGDGVFETIKYSEGKLYQFVAHLERMKRSAAGLFLAPPCPWEDIGRLILEVAAAGKIPTGQVRVLLGRGCGGFGVDPGECPLSSLYIVAYRFHPKPESWFTAGLRGFRSAIPAKQSYLAQLKNTNYVPNALMIREAGERGLDVPFCFDHEGNLAESAIANICIVDKNGGLAVPEFRHSLRGTTLLRAMELLDGSLPVAVRPIAEEEIFTAREILLLGTGPDCVAISSYEGRSIGNGASGPVAERTRQLIRDDVRRNGVPVPGLA